jgi:hypothetical protein
VGKGFGHVENFTPKIMRVENSAEKKTMPAITARQKRTAVGRVSGTPDFCAGAGED